MLCYYYNPGDLPFLFAKSSNDVKINIQFSGISILYMIHRHTLHKEMTDLVRVGLINQLWPYILLYLFCMYLSVE